MLKYTLSKNLKDYFNMKLYPFEYTLYFHYNLILWTVANLGMIFIFSVIYYYYDVDNHVSNFNGLEDGKRYYYEYLYLSGMVGTLVGFGDITAKRQMLPKFLLIAQVLISLFVNFVIISFKELKLADDP